MDYYELDDQIKALIDKANRIVQVEELKKERIDTLTSLREEDGRLKIAIQQKSKEIVTLKANLTSALNILQNHQVYFKLINSFSGEQLVEKLNEQIEDYSWPKYSKLQDELYRLTKDKSRKEMEDEINTLQKQLDDLELKRSNLVDRSVKIMKEIDQTLSEVSGW